MRKKNNLTNKKIAPILLDRIVEEVEKITYGDIVLNISPGKIILKTTEYEQFLTGTSVKEDE